jgi:hypothetical protein
MGMGKRFRRPNIQQISADLSQYIKKHLSLDIARASKMQPAGFISISRVIRFWWFVCIISHQYVLLTKRK